MKIVFLGNHTVGVRTLGAIQREFGVAGVVAHPPDPEDGVRYESVFAAAGRLGVPAIRAAGRSPELARFIADCAPDLVWIADYRYLLPAALLKLPRCGTVNLHPSLLPRYRGRAPINWAILQGESRLGLTAHFVDEGMDTGDIIAQREYVLAPGQDVGDALAMLYPLYEAITGEVLAAFRSGRVPRRPQDHGLASAFPRRTPADGLIDWSKPARDVWNLIRAVAAPYPGAFAPWEGGVLRVWRAGGIRVAAPRTARAVPGEILDASPDGRSVVVACGDGALVVTDCQYENSGGRTLRAGDVLGAVPELSLPNP